MALRLTITILDKEETLNVLKEYWATVYGVPVQSVEFHLSEEEGLQTTIKHELPVRGYLKSLADPAPEPVRKKKAKKPAVEETEEEEEEVPDGLTDNEKNDWTKFPKTAGRHRKDDVKRVQKRADRIARLRREQEVDAGNMEPNEIDISEIN